MWSDVGVQSDAGGHSLMVERGTSRLLRRMVRAVAKGERSIRMSKRECCFCEESWVGNCRLL